MGTENGDDNRKLFLELKGICVPLLAQSRIDNKSIPKILALLSELSECLKTHDRGKNDLSPALISYAFFPLSTLLTRNEPATIPDQVLERIFNVLDLLFRWWWWTCEDAIWEQVLMISGSVVGGLIGKGKSRERADETKEAATRLLLRLLQNPKSTGESVKKDDSEAGSRFKHFQSHAQSPKLVPIIGQTLNALLLNTNSSHHSFQLASLSAIEIIVASYIPDGVVPSILPGVASTATRIALGKAQNTSSIKGPEKAWANGASVAASLRVLQIVVIRAISDTVCIAAGIVKEIRGLEDLAELVSGEAASSSAGIGPTDSPAYETRRTPSWLRASASQLLIAFNTLSPLVSHPNPNAQIALASFSSTILSETHLTLPDIQPLLLSFLLSSSISSFPRVSSSARDSLTTLLASGTPGAPARLQILTQQTANNFSALPRVLPARDDAKIQHVTGQIAAAASLPAAKSSVAYLLGPAGHVEKWGTRLLSVLEFEDPSASIVPVSAAAGVAGLLLEPDADSAEREERVAFPEARLRHATTRDTHQAVERMLRVLGRAGGAACLFALEWFVRAGLVMSSALGEPGAVGALWCACRIFEGVAGVSLSEDEAADIGGKASRSLEGADRRKVEKFARWAARVVTELWEKEDDYEEPTAPSDKREVDTGDDQDRLALEYVKGVTPFETRFDILQSKSSNASAPRTRRQPSLQKSFALQLLAVSANVLRSHFSTLLISSLYPLLHSLLPPITSSSHPNPLDSNDAFLATTASSALTSISQSMGFASPRNLLLAHFDYALDGAARHLTRAMLDPHAARVLALLVRLAGKDVVQNAGDVVEMCFDRLDDFHGYSVIVDGLLEALVEVVKAVAENEDEGPKKDEVLVTEESSIPDAQKFKEFVHWLEHRKDPKPVQAEEPIGNGIHPLPPPGAEEKGKSKDNTRKPSSKQSTSELASPPPTPSQSLTSQIVSRSISLLTHGSPTIRTRILSLLTLAVPVLPADALLPAVHRAWPFILNRLKDSQTPVVSAASALVAALAETHGEFMAQRVWADVWPRFRNLLAELDRADRQSALARRGQRAGTATATVGTDSAYTHAHRLYRSMLLTMSAAMRGRVPVEDRAAWDVLLAFRRFLHAGAHPELQARARELYIAFGTNNADAVWLVLTSTSATNLDKEGTVGLKHLREERWDIQANMDAILEEIDKAQQ